MVPASWPSTADSDSPDGKIYPDEVKAPVFWGPYIKEGRGFAERGNRTEGTESPAFGYYNQIRRDPGE
jgi:hypothetical protein